MIVTELILCMVHNNELYDYYEKMQFISKDLPNRVTNYIRNIDGVQAVGGKPFMFDMNVQPKTVIALPFDYEDQF